MSRTEWQMRQYDEVFERSEVSRPLENRVLRDGHWFTRCKRCRELDSELLNDLCGTCASILMDEEYKEAHHG